MKKRLQKNQRNHHSKRRAVCVTAMIALCCTMMYGCRNPEDSVKPDPEWKAVLDQTPSAQYINYPGGLGEPVLAILYQGGTPVVLDLHDTRLIRLTNFCNYAAFAQKMCIRESCEEDTSQIAAEDRLELYFGELPCTDGESDRVVIVKNTVYYVFAGMPPSEDCVFVCGRIPYGADEEEADWLRLAGF